MLGEKALELVKEMERAKDGRLPAYNVSQAVFCSLVRLRGPVKVDSY